MGFPDASAVKKPLSRRQGFHPWVGKIHWRREWLPTAVFLSGEFHGQRALWAEVQGGCRVRHS